MLGLYVWGGPTFLGVFRYQGIHNTLEDPSSPKQNNPHSLDPQQPPPTIQNVDAFPGKATT
eukprot:6339840-Amphidinium_carterae.1